MKISNRERSAGIVEKIFHDGYEGYTFCKVEVGKVRVDASYQRDHDERHSDRLSLRDKVKTPPPMVSYRDGALWAYEGQHRIQKWRKVGRKHGIVCLSVLSREEEAYQYSELNGSIKRPNPWNRFKARLMAGDKEAIEQRDIAHAYGLKMHYEGGYNNVLKSTSPIEESYRAGFYDEWIILMSTFRHVKMPDCMAREVRDSIEFQRGLIDLLRKFGVDTIMQKKVLDALVQIGAELIANEAKRCCGCSRAVRNHFLQSMELLLSRRRLLPSQ